MGRIAAIGAELTIEGFALAGVVLLPADEPTRVTAAWQALPDDVELVILTAAAADVLGSAALDGERPLVAVISR